MTRLFDVMAQDEKNGANKTRRRELEGRIKAEKKRQRKVIHREGEIP